MIVQGQSFSYNQYQTQNRDNLSTEKPGKVLPHHTDSAQLAIEKEYDFTKMSMKELSAASKVLYDEGVINLGQHASLSLHYHATKTGLNQASGAVSPAALAKAESEQIDVIAMQRDKLREATKNGVESEIEFAKDLLKTLEAYQFGAGGAFYTSA
ncbi:hypothetical protein L1077_22135 [Pseudoalteromonas luteoviolacea]|uniref:hypothetical protein n=1 Tax=Pseudoalteromonas luteoviolacea TaxID=43657 RepID=UPI001F3D7B00|nr:hypothetical protein [Pseudoalteromonas luteoviolacea]MCF6442130.1 hypothetical protein [Pseudoalteromonas luteoviolacea]